LFFLIQIGPLGPNTLALGREVGNADAQTFNRNELIVHKQEWDLPLPRRHSSLLIEIFKTFTWGIGFDL
jgi:hypothetical protein